MNIEKFISKRLDKKNSKKKYSKSISDLCVIAIASSLTIIIISICTGMGLEESIKKNFIDLNGNIIIENYSNSNSAHNIGEKGIYLNDSTLSKIKNIPEVKFINKVISTFSVISNNRDFMGVILNGIDYENNKDFLNKKIIKGKKPINKFDILISKSQSSKLNLNLNDTILLSFIRKSQNKYEDTHSQMKICGIYESEIENFDKNICFVNLNYIEKKIGWKNQFSSYKIFLKNNKKTLQVNNYINNNISGISNNYMTKSYSIYDKHTNIFDWISLFKKNIILITIIMLIVCLINITKFLLVMVIERINMIGVLKSFGTNDFKILKIFYYRATNIVLKGILYGNFIGFFICVIQKKFKIIKLDSSSYFVNEIPIFFDFNSIFLANFLILALIPIAIMIPYFKISKLTLSNSLKIK